MRRAQRRVRNLEYATAVLRYHAAVMEFEEAEGAFIHHYRKRNGAGVVNSWAEYLEVRERWASGFSRNPTAVVEVQRLSRLRAMLRCAQKMALGSLAKS